MTVSTFRFKKLVHVLRGMAGNVDPDFPHDLDRFRMNVTGRLRASALHVDKIPRSLPQNSFCHVTATGISGAEDKNDWFIVHTSSFRLQAGV